MLARSICVEIGCDVISEINGLDQAGTVELAEIKLDGFCMWSRFSLAVDAVWNETIEGLKRKLSESAEPFESANALLTKDKREIFFNSDIEIDDGVIWVKSYSIPIAALNDSNPYIDYIESGGSLKMIALCL